MGKYLLAILMEGHNAVLFDNIKQGLRLENNELSKAMTNPTYSNRILGSNTTISVPSQVLWLFSGNNIILCGDFKTRILPIRLNAKIDEPDRRKFTRPDIAKWCEEKREEILHACMTILIGSNIPEKISPSRFTDWDKFVRFPLIVATDGKIDIMDLFERNKQADPQTEGLLNLFDAWHVLFKETKLTATEVLQTINGSISPIGNADQRREYQEALKNIFNGIVPDSQIFGTWLRKYKGKIIGGYILESSIGTKRQTHNIQCWHLLLSTK